jgi:hypothetical protein
MRSRKIADGTYLRWTINPQPGAGTRPLGSRPSAWSDCTTLVRHRRTDPQMRFAAIQYTTLRRMQRHHLGSGLRIERRSFHCTRRSLLAVDIPMFFNHCPPLCITGNHGRAIFSVLSTVPTPILTGHYACNCIPNDIGRCPVSVMPMIPIVFFNRRYARFLGDFKPDLQLSIGLLGSNPKVFGIIHANPHSKILMHIEKCDVSTSSTFCKEFFT